MFRFTINDIWKLLVSIWSTNSLYIDVKYAGLIWIVHSRALFGRYLITAKKFKHFVRTVSHEYPLLSFHYFLTFISDNTRLKRTMNCPLSRVWHSTSCTNIETHPTHTFFQMNINYWLLMWNLVTWLFLEHYFLVCPQKIQQKMLDYQNNQLSQKSTLMLLLS